MVSSGREVFEEALPLVGGIGGGGGGAARFVGEQVRRMVTFSLFDSLGEEDPVGLAPGLAGLVGIDLAGLDVVGVELDEAPELDSS